MTHPPRKISDMILEMAQAFIAEGQTLEEKQNRLSTACTAWNMACGSEEDRPRRLEQYLEGCKQFHPALTPDELAKMRSDIESLIEQKLKSFAEDRRQIVSAEMVMVGSGFRIEVGSANLS